MWPVWIPGLTPDPSFQASGADVLQDILVEDGTMRLTPDGTGFLHIGENDIQIDLFSTLGNTLGHSRHKVPWLDPGNKYEEFFLQPFGLGGAPELRVVGCLPSHEFSG